MTPSPATAPLSASKQELLQRLLRGEVTSSQAERLGALGFAAPPATLAHDAAGRFEPFPLTDMQQAYWVGRQRSLELGNVAIHSYLELRIPRLDVARLERAWNAVIDRHDMLRGIVRRDGQQQVLRDVGRYGIPESVFASAPEHDAARTALRERMSHRVFEPDRWPLFELAVTNGPDAGSVLHLSLDGVLLDAWSLSTVIRECLELYEAPDRTLPPLPVTFRDYVLAERAMRDTAEYRAALEWWHRRLDDLPEPPALPLIRSPRSIRRPTFVRRGGSLDASRWQRLRQRAGAEGLTAPCLLLTLYAHVLSQWTASRRFTLNVPRFDRLPLHPGVDDLVGEFASFTLLACDMTRPGSVLELGRALQRDMWDALEHGQVSGMAIVRELMRRHGRGRATFPVVFTGNPTLGAHKPAAAPTSLEGHVLEAITQTPQVWLDFQAGEHDGALAFNWDAVGELFPPGMLDQMHASLTTLLNAIADRDDLATPLS